MGCIIEPASATTQVCGLASERDLTRGRVSELTRESARAPGWGPASVQERESLPEPALARELRLVDDLGPELVSAQESRRERGSPRERVPASHRGPALEPGRLRELGSAPAQHPGRELPPEREQDWRLVLGPGPEQALEREPAVLELAAHKGNVSTESGGLLLLILAAGLYRVAQFPG